MKRVLALLLIILCVGVFAETPNADSWMIATFPFGGTLDITPSLELDSGNSLALKISSSTEGKGVFKMWRIIEHPDSDVFEISFDVRVNAPNVDLDHDKAYSSGEGVNSDGPNLFSFTYAFNEATPNRPGFDPLVFNPSAYPGNSSICHANLQCNWVGDPEQYYGVYCSYEHGTLPGAIADGPSVTTAWSNGDFTQEAFGVNEWKKVRMNYNAGECDRDKLTVQLTAVDALSDTPYTWEFRNFEVTATSNSYLTFDEFHIYDGTDFTKLEPPAYCGDGDKNAAEECDGIDGETEGLYCQSDCTLKAECGDNFIAGNEVCDGLKVTKGFSCSNDCSTEDAVCGDGVLVGEEVCDPGMPSANISAIVTDGFACSSDCKSEISVCGDSIVVGLEECDGTSGVAGDHTCASDCTEYRILKTEENAIINKIIPLALEADFGQPAISEVEFENNGTLDLEDILDQTKLRNVTQLQNANFSFCTPAFPDCEDKYMFSEDFIVSAEAFSFEERATGLMKVYKVQNGNDTLYLIGVKHEKSPLDFLYDPGFWMMSGGLILVGVVAAVLLVLVLLGLFMYSRKKGIPITQVPGRLLKRKKGL